MRWMDAGCPFQFFFFNDTATTEIYTLSLHDALPISLRSVFGDVVCVTSLGRQRRRSSTSTTPSTGRSLSGSSRPIAARPIRSEEHTSELQSRQYLVCRLLLEKKKPRPHPITSVSPSG